MKATTVYATREAYEAAHNYVAAFYNAQSEAYEVVKAFKTRSSAEHYASEHREVEVMTRKQFAKLA